MAQPTFFSLPQRDRMLDYVLDAVKKKVTSPVPEDPAKAVELRNKRMAGSFEDLKDNAYLQAKATEIITGPVRKVAANVYEDKKKQARAFLTSVIDNAKAGMQKKIDEMFPPTTIRYNFKGEPVNAPTATPTPTTTMPDPSRPGSAGENMVFVKDKDGVWKVMPRDKAPKATPTPTAIPKVLAAEAPQAAPTPADKFKKERDEEGKIGEYIREVWPPSEHQKVPVVLDGENGGRVANMAVDPRTGRRYFIQDPKELEAVVANADPKRGVDIGIMQINSNTFNDFMRRKRAQLEKQGITSITDMLDPKKNIQMGRIVWNEQGWNAWYGAPAEYRKGK